MPTAQEYDLCFPYLAFNLEVYYEFEEGLDREGDEFYISAVYACDTGDSKGCTQDLMEIMAQEHLDNILELVMEKHYDNEG